MTESDGEAVWLLARKLEAKLEEFQRFRADPTIGMQHELPAMANVVGLMAELVLALAAKADLP